MQKPLLEAETIANTDRCGSHFQTVNLAGSAGCVLLCVLAEESAILPSVELMTLGQGKPKGMNYGCKLSGPERDDEAARPSPTRPLNHHGLDSAQIV